MWVIQMANAISKRPPCIAIVEDSEAVRRSLSLLLLARGYAASGFESGEALLSSPSRNLFDFLLIDFKLDGVSGTDLLRKLRKDGVTTPAVLISGWEGKELEKEASSAGFMSLVRKPMLEHHLFSVIASVLGPRAAAPTGS